MNFIFNENACKAIINNCNKRLASIVKEISLLEHDRDLAIEPEVRKAIEAILANRQLNKISEEKKIWEMQQHLNSRS